MKIVAVLCSLLYFGALITLVVLWGRMTDFLTQPGGEGGELVTVTVPEGAKAADMPALLEKAGVANNRELFQTYVDEFFLPGKVIPGEYAIAPTMTPVQQIARVESGEVVTYTFAVKAGARATETLDILGGLQLGDRAKLAELVEDRAFLESLGVDGPSLEGFLYPDAYSLPRGLGEKALLAKLLERYEGSAGAMIREAAEKRQLTPYQLVTLASLVELAKVPSKERRFFAAVLLARLDAKKPLKSEAAFAYGLTQKAPPEPKKKRRRRKKREHPWDTRKAPGLPKTPICSPSLASLQAVANPAPVKALYMVQREDGTHVYCVDAECYWAALRRWRKGATPMAPVLAPIEPAAPSAP